MECDESYCNDGGGGTIFGRRGCGEFFYHESYCDERVVMNIYGFQFFCDVCSGGGVMPLYGIWVGSTIILERHNATGFGGD